MNMNKRFIKNLLAGESFVADFTHGTVYVVDRVSTQDNLTAVDYHIVSQYADEGVKPSRGRFVKVNLTTVTVL
jgi:hypothetical protein